MPTVPFPVIPGVEAVREGASVTTGVMRASFANVVRPKPSMSDPAKLEYSIVLIVPKSDPVVNILKAATKDAIAKKWPNKVPGNLRNPVRDCSEKDYEGFDDDCFYITCRTTDVPGVIDQAMTKITDPNVLYSGCFVRARIGAFGYDKAGNVGVAFGLQHVQKLADGPALTGRKPAEEVFGPVVAPGDPFAQSPLFD